MITYFESFEKAVADTPDELFLSIHGRTSRQVFGFRRFYESCLSYAAAFQSRDVVAGDHVLIFSGTSEETFFAFFGAQMIGAVPAIFPPLTSKQNPVYYRTSHNELWARIRPKLVTGSAAALEVLQWEKAISFEGLGAAAIDMTARSRLHLVKPGQATHDVALLQHSSGTTGLKKGVMLGYRAVTAQVAAYAQALELGPRDRIASWLPLYHDMGLIACTVTPFATATPVAVMDPFVWTADPLAIFRMADAENSTLCWMPNFAFEHMANFGKVRPAKEDLSRLRMLISCSEVCREPTFQRFARQFERNGLDRSTLHTSYALAENVFAASQSRPGEGPLAISLIGDALDRGVVDLCPADAVGARTVLSSGRALTGCEIRIANGVAEHSAAEGVVGEILISSDCLFDGYFRNETLTAERLVDGWYHSRDHGFLHEGHLFVLGRLDEIIIYRGRNLVAADLEAALGNLDGMKPGRAIAFGVYDEQVGSEQVAVMVELIDGADVDPKRVARDIRVIFQDNFSVNPSYIKCVRVNALAKTTSGKISRVLNKEKFLRDAFEAETWQSAKTLGNA